VTFFSCSQRGVVIGRLKVARAFQVTRIEVECCRDERFVKARTVNPKNFFAELKRRKVCKVAIAYGLVAWLLLIQIATQIFPFLELPNWAIRLVIMLIVIGFPIALIIAWAFELTPEGLKRTESADELPKKAPRNRAWIYVVIIAGAISVGVFFLGRYTSSRQNGVAGLPSKSIAVLPFDNQNRDPNTDYLSDGIPESIINSLSQLPNLKVMSRNSVFHYKGKDMDAPTVAKELKVQAVLTGRMTQRGDGLSISVELIKNRFTNPGRETARNALNHTADRVPFIANLLDERYHSFRARGVWTANDIFLHVLHLDSGAINFRDDVVNLRYIRDDLEIRVER